MSSTESSSQDWGKSATELYNLKSINAKIKAENYNSQPSTMLNLYQNFTAIHIELHPLLQA